MNAVFVVIVHVIANHPPQMLFAQRDDVIEDLTAAASDPALCDSILPRCLNTRALWLEASCLQKFNHIAVELRVAIQDGITVRTSLPETLHAAVAQPNRKSGDW